MDFEFTPEEERFRRDVRQFLDEELPDWWRGMFVDDDRVMPFTRSICRKLAQRGWLTLSWPEEYGGAGESIWKQAVLREEMWAHHEPRGPQYMNLNYIGPMIMRFGTPEQKQRFLPPMAAGNVLWTQGFSEPDAGSDLGSLKTRATDLGDVFVVNGQKIWNSYADAPAEWCLLLARTDPDAPKHKGISVLLVDMKTPGITVRPIRSMSGPGDINEIFFDDVEVPYDCLLGEKNRGWDLIVQGLSFERVGIARYARVGAIIDELVEFTRKTVVDGQPLSNHPDVRDRLADLHVRYQAARLLNYRAISLQAQGEAPANEASIARVHNTLLEQEAGQVGLEILGLAGQLKPDDRWARLGGEMERQWVHNISTTITAGSTEIQKNIIAQRGLGLPRAW
jgi:alkylation response protein AidB-like acyl-CoA dehydrogenase